jgi:hypothetical protein
MAVRHASGPWRPGGSWASAWQLASWQVLVATGQLCVADGQQATPPCLAYGSASFFSCLPSMLGIRTRKQLSDRGVVGPCATLSSRLQPAWTPGLAGVTRSPSSFCGAWRARRGMRFRVCVAVETATRAGVRVPGQTKNQPHNPAQGDANPTASERSTVLIGALNEIVQHQLPARR